MAQMQAQAQGISPKSRQAYGKNGSKQNKKGLNEFIYHPKTSYTTDSSTASSNGSDGKPSPPEKLQLETTSNSSSSFENQAAHYGIDCVEFHPTAPKFTSQVVDQSDSDSLMNTTACETVDLESSKMDISSV